MRLLIVAFYFPPTGGGGVLLNVKRADGKEYEVPFAAAICTEIDIAGKKIVVQLPEGIDED